MFRDNRARLHSQSIDQTGFGRKEQMNNVKGKNHVALPTTVDRCF